jgi:DNA-binding NarL/FixJ family response regulator
LTKREYQVLIHLSLGLSNREISKSLSISLDTVKEHVQNILRKLKINDRTAAAIWSLKNGIPTLSFDTPTPNQTLS